MKAWNSFLIIATHHTPFRSLELVQYQALVSHLFQVYPIQVVIRYDQLFRQVYRDPLLRWDTFKEDLLVWCSTRWSFRAPISSRLGPPPTDTTVGCLHQQPPTLMDPLARLTQREVQRSASTTTSESTQGGGGGGVQVHSFLLECRLSSSALSQGMPPAGCHW